jgi:hypothetical protein
MSYRVFYGDAFSMSGRDLHQQQEVRHERFSTEHEALNRARELLDDDQRTVVAVCDAAGNQVSGVCLQLRLGYCCE